MISLFVRYNSWIKIHIIIDHYIGLSCFYCIPYHADTCLPIWAECMDTNSQVDMNVQREVKH